MTTPSEIWRSACLAQIEEFRAFGYDIRPFIKPVPYPGEAKRLWFKHDNLDEPSEIVKPRVPFTGKEMEPVVWNQQRVRIKKSHELPGCKGLHYNVLLREKSRSLIINVNTVNKEHSFWIKNSKIEKV